MTQRRPVFVYGTLRPGQPGFEELDLGARMAVIGPARVTGTLYDLGDYPGAVRNGGGLIVGDLLMPRDDEILSLLDAYELFTPSDPAESEYLRVLARVEETGLETWIYVYNFPLYGFDAIASGDWLERPVQPRPDRATP